VLALVLAESLCASLSPPVQDSLPVLVHLQLDDGDLAGVDANVGGGTVGLLPLDTLNVDPRKVDYTPILIETNDSPELGPVALEDLANLLALVVASHHLHLVVLPHGHGADAILGPQLLGEGGGHETAPDVGWGRKMPFTGLGPVGGNVLVKLHFGGNETSLQDGKLNLILKRISQYKEMHRFLRGTTWLSGHKSFREKLRKLLKFHSEPV